MKKNTPKVPLWTEADYAPVITGSGARKLASSAVAPLVAAGRGMLTITPANLKTMQAFLNCGRSDSVKSKCISNAVRNTDALYMPWYTPLTVTEMHREKMIFASPSPQFRPNPANVIYNEHGKGPKYVNMVGCPLVIGIHPSTPDTWQASRGLRIMVTEGMIKADSALTAMLLDAGVTADELRLTEADLAADGDMEKAYACSSRLEQLMGRVPEADRILIYAFVSVTTFSRNPEWMTVDARGQDMFVAFDGDTATNPNVWRQAKQLFDFATNQLKATPKLIDLSGQALPDDPAAKCGMDDYLASVGDWRDLLALTADQLPAQPEDDSATPGAWRMNRNTLTTEEYVPGATADLPGTWRTKYRFVARIRAIEDRRQVLPEEGAEGVYIEREDAREMDSRVEIEVSWNDLDGETRIGVITGPHDLMMTPPTEWRRITPKASIPSSVAALRDWPPSEKEFTNAMKDYRISERVVRPLWNHMGWVPTKDDVPVFLVGEQVVGADGLMPTAAASAVTNAELRVASKYGVQIPESDDQVRQAFRDVLDAYRPEDNTKSPFRNPRHASIILATAMRPCAPKRCAAPIMLSGSSGGGKALPMDALLPVPVSDRFPTGWARNAQLVAGDQLYGPDGTPTRIRSLSQVWDDETMYELILDDGQTVRMSGNHVMVVSTGSSRQANTAFAEHAGASDAEADRLQAAARLRRLAGLAAGGDASSLKELAKVSRFGERQLRRLVRRKGIPHDHVWLPDREQQTTAYDAGAPAVQNLVPGTESSLTGLEAAKVTVARSIHKRVRHYPTAEVLEALAEHIDNGMGECVPLTVSMKVSDMAGRVGDSFGIPVAGAISGAPARLPAAPYTLGVWLAGADAANGHLTVTDDEIISHMESDGYRVDRVRSANPTVTVAGLTEALHAENLSGNKRIPPVYLRAPIVDRVALLQGLMDAEGTVNPNNECDISVTDEHLAADLLELIRSLGVKATLHTAAAGEDSGTDPQTDTVQYRVLFTPGIPVFRTARKLACQQLPVEPSRQWLFVNDIRQVETVPSRCLQVEHRSGQFLCSGFVVTHNSWASAAIMMFWQSKPGTWHEKSLPGSASDTYTDAEVSISKTPIWVVDDLAPSEDDPQGTGRKAAGVFLLIRNAHNGNSRGRRQADMRAMDSNMPRAQLIVSAEQTPEHQQSIMNRSVHIKVRYRQFLSESSAPTTLVNNLGKTRSPQSILTGYCLMMLARKARRHGWVQLMDDLNEEMQIHEERATEVIGNEGDSARQAGDLADLALGLSMLDWMMAELGMENELAERLASMRDDLYQAAKEGYNSSRDTVLGTQFLSALRSTLRSHHAHVGALGDAGMPMSAGAHGDWKADVDFTNDALGWERGEDGSAPKACGPRIGDLVYDRKGDPCILFDTKASVAAVKRAHEGFRTHSVGEVWDSVVAQGFRHDKQNAGENGWAVRTSGGGSNLLQRVSSKGRQFEGVIISLKTLLDIEVDEDDEPSDSRAA